MDSLPDIAHFPPCSEATQCVTLYSRQGTRETIEEVEDEQDQLEDRTQAPSASWQLDDGHAAEYSPWSDGDPGELEEGREGPESEQEVEGAAPWETFGATQRLSLGPEEAGPALSAPEKDLTTESDDGEGIQDLMRPERKTGLLHTPDTDASKTSDTDVPPSYSKAVSFDHLDVSDDDDSDMDRKRRMVMTSDSRSDSRSDIMLPSMTTELTASELLLNK